MGIDVEPGILVQPDDVVHALPQHLVQKKGIDFLAAILRKQPFCAQADEWAARRHTSTQTDLTSTRISDLFSWGCP